MSREESFAIVDIFREFLNETTSMEKLNEQPAGMAMDPIQQQIQMSIQVAQEQLGPLYGQLQGMLIQLRSLNTVASNAEAKRQAGKIDLVHRDLSRGDISPMDAMAKLGSVANTMGKKLQQLAAGGQ